MAFLFRHDVRITANEFKAPHLAFSVCLINVGFKELLRRVVKKQPGFKGKSWGLW